MAKKNNVRDGLVSCIEMWHFFFLKIRDDIEPNNLQSN